MLRMLVFSLAAAALSSCFDDNDLLYVRMADRQPDAAQFGRLLSVFASPSEDSELEVRVVGGTLRSAVDLTDRELVCLEIKKNELFEAKVAVIPNDGEAVLIAIIRGGADGSSGTCSGVPRTQITVPIQRVGSGEVADTSGPDASTDATIEADSNVGASADANAAARSN